MQFNSLYFIIFFLPITLAGYWLINGRRGQSAANTVLAAASIVFYAFAGWKALVLLVLGIIANWWLAWLLVRAYCLDKQRQHRFWLVVGIVFNAGILLYFKYTGFFLTNLQRLLNISISIPDMILPLGISFTTFTQIAWLVDASRGETQSVTFREYALFILWFPKLTQGPISFQKDFIPQEREQKAFQPDQMMQGICMFVLGLSKKLFLADRFGSAVDWGFEYIQLTNCWDMLIVMLSYTLQIYFDFSGYSDMAIGISLLFGYELPQNFNSPYKAISVTQFWRRWHMSLTRFLREYIYFPLGGSRKGNFRTYLNIMIVYLVSGFWHGANWTFVLWGMLHGAIQCLERCCAKLCHHSEEKDKRPVHAWLRFLRWLLTFLIISFLWLLFRSPSVSEYNRALFHIFRQIVPITQTNVDLLAYFGLPGLRAILSVLGISYTDRVVYVISTIVMLAGSMVLVVVPQNNEERRFRGNAFTLTIMVILAVLCIMSLSNVSTFIYNNF